MKKFILSFALMLGLTSVTAQAGIIDFGILAGMNMSKVSYKNLSNNFDPANRFGFYVGPKVNVSLLGFGADAAILYNQKRMNLDDDYSRTLRSIEIPINARYTFGIGSIASVYAATGPQFGFNVGNTEWNHVLDGQDTTFKRENANFSWNIGAGAKLLGHLEVGLVYNIALSKYAKVLKAVGVGGVSTDTSVKNNTFQIQAAYIF